MEINHLEASIDKIFIHKVGNKSEEEGYVISKKEVVIDRELNTLLTHYFLSHFKSEEQYHFFHDTELAFNETHSYVSNILNNPDLILEQSTNLAQHLYNKSTHPKIKGGEFYTVYIKNCNLNGEIFDAVGLFKSENKDTFLEIEQISDGYEIESKEGLNLSKLDKGAIIFNTQVENGYLVSIVDNTNRSTEAQYWKDEFLGIQALKNDFHQTNEFLGIAKKFVTKQLSEDFEVTKADQIDLLNRSVEYFKSNDKFEKADFEESVFQEQELIESFKQFDSAYRYDNNLELADSFEISAQAVKKQARVFKSVLKLDKNFHIYIHGDKELIEQGVEKDGRKYYKIYYNAES